MPVPPRGRNRRVNVPEDLEADAAGPATLSSGGLSSGGMSSAGLSSGGMSSGAHDAGARADLDDPDEEVIEVEPEPYEEAAPPNGFHAFLRHANLHNLL